MDMRRLFLVFSVVTITFIIIGYHNVAEAQQPQGALGNTYEKLPANKKDNPSQKRENRSGEKNRRQQLPKPEQYKLGNGTKKNLRKRKKARKKITICKKCAVNTSADLPIADKKTKKNRGNRLKVTTERVDDIPLLINIMLKAGVQQTIDNFIPVQRNQRELSWGWTTVIWLAYILSTGDHRKVSVQEYVSRMKTTLNKLSGQMISEIDFADDRLAVLTKYLSKEEYWIGIEQSISEQSISVYELSTDTIRVDATTVSGYHETIEGELFQYGHSKDDPSRPQIKIMTGSLDPLGMPLASDVVSGERADDGLYLPIIDRLSSMLRKKGLLYIGDCKLSSIENRLHIREKAKGHYLSPLPNTGKTPEYMTEWINEGIQKDEHDELIKYVVVNDKGEELKAKGYETERELSVKTEDKEIKWTERVLIVNSPTYAKQQRQHLEKRLEKAKLELLALTPPRGKGKKQIIDEALLIEATESILKKRKVQGLIDYEYVKEIETEIKYIGKGRGSANREKWIEEKVRYQITKVNRHEEKISETVKGYGWKVYVTDVSKDRLGFIDIVRAYRSQYRIERIFNRLKSHLNISPLYVKRKDQIKGMTHLLLLGVRVYSLIEYIARRSLLSSSQKLAGLHPENKRKVTATPSCERILKAFSNITLTILETNGKVTKHLTPLSQVQTEILSHLGINSTIYNSLAENT